MKVPWQVSATTIIANPTTNKNDPLMYDINRYPIIALAAVATANTNIVK